MVLVYAFHGMHTSLIRWERPPCSAHLIAQHVRWADCSNRGVPSYHGRIWQYLLGAARGWQKFLAKKPIKKAVM